jgi:hypothetical protein
MHAFIDKKVPNGTIRLNYVYEFFYYYPTQDFHSPSQTLCQRSEPESLNFKGAQESIRKNQFRRAAYVAWRSGTTTLFLLSS